MLLGLWWIKILCCLSCLLCFFHLLVSSLSFDRGFGSELLVIFVLDQKVFRWIQLEHKNDILTIY